MTSTEGVPPTADRLRDVVAKWLHANRPNETPNTTDCVCYSDAGDILRTMNQAMGGKGTDDLAALIAHFKELPTWTK